MMAFPEITQSLKELDPAGDGRVALCGSGPLVQAVKAQGLEPPASLGPVLVVDDGDDAATLRRLEGLIAASSKLPVTLVVNIADRALMRAVEARLFDEGISPRPVIVSAADLMAEQALAQARLFETAQARNQPQLHVAMLGFGALGRAFLDELVLNGMADGLQAPAIDIITADVARAEAILRRDMPEIGASAAISVQALHIEELGDPKLSPVVVSETKAPLTAIFVLFDDENLTLRAVAEICALQNLHGLAHAALFVGGAGASQAVKLVAAKRGTRNFAMGIHEIASLDAIDDLLTTILVKRDAVARRIHDAYQAQYAGQTQASTSWEKLPETYRRANRRAASHLVQKLSALALDLRGDPATVSPNAYERVIAPLAKSSVEDQTMRNLARLEHDRWCADRRLDGWRHGDIRDDGRRLHPSLVPFDDPRLSADEIGKDVAQMRFLLGSVVQAQARGATACFHVGIVERAAQPGLDVKAVQARFAAEPDRTVILISPLLNDAELKAASMLLLDLKAAQRTARLIIPEWFAGNATLRDQTVARSGKLAALLADERVFIAPIGPQQFSASEDWAEVEVTEGQRRSLISYVTQRADVLVSAQNPDHPS